MTRLLIVVLVYMSIYMFVAHLTYYIDIRISRWCRGISPKSDNCVRTCHCISKTVIPRSASKNHCNIGRNDIAHADFNYALVCVYIYIYIAVLSIL